MRTKTFAVLVCLAVVSVTAAGAQLTAVQGGGQRQVLVPGETDFELNTSLSGPFTISLYNASDDVVVLNASMELVVNASYDRYRYNLTINGSELFHDIETRVWRDSSSFDPYVIASERFHAAIDTPTVFEAVTRPYAKVPGDNVTVEANISDAGDDLSTVTLDIDNTTSSMTRKASYDGFFTYVSDGNDVFDSAGSYSYGIETSDGSRSRRFSDAFWVADADEADSTEIGVSVRRGCLPAVQGFEAPGSPTPAGLNLLAIKSTDNMTLDLANAGGYDINFTVRMNVTKEDDEWLPGEQFGNLSELYPLQNVSIAYRPDDTVDPRDSVLRNNFTLINRTGFFTARYEANYTCFEGSRVLEEGGLAGYDNFFIGKAGGGDEGGDQEELGPGGDNQTVTFGGEDQNGTISFNGTTITISFNGTNISIGVSDQNISLGGDLEEIDFGGDNPLAGPGGDEPQYGGGGDEPRFGEGGDQPQFGEGGQQPDFGPGGQQPQARPILSVTMRPLNTSYETIRRRFGEVRFEIENEGGIPIEDLSVRPRVGSFDGTWETQTAGVANLSQGEAVNRSVFIRPDEDVDPGIYQVPLLATGGGNESDLAVQYVPFVVRPEVFESRLNITEVPRSIRVERNTSTTIPVLLENAGATNLTNITAELQNVEDVGTARAQVVGSIAVNGSTALQIRFNASDAVESTNATLIVSTAEGAYSFANIGIEVTPERGIVPPEFRLPLVAVIWTVLLVIYALVTRFYDLDSLLVRVPFVLLILGEVILILYVATEYYGITTSLLPF